MPEADSIGWTKTWVVSPPGPEIEVVGEGHRLVAVADRLDVFRVGGELGLDAGRRAAGERHASRPARRAGR